MPAIVELTIRRPPDDRLVAELRAELPRSRADLGSAPVTISTEALRGLRLLPDAYGAALTAMALPQALQPAWQRARGYTEGSDQGLHVRVLLDDPTGELHALRWELLRDPLTNTPLAQQEGGSLARLVILDDLHERVLPARPNLRALVAVAGPVDAKQWGLDPVDVAGEAARARQALGELRADLLADTAPGSPGLATLDHLRDRLRAGPHVLFLICHGKETAQGTVLYLVDGASRAAPITGEALAAEVAALDPAHRPLLAVLVACEGASQDEAPLASVGPLLARKGIPAVVAMQAPIAMDAAARFTERLLRELARDGRIDRAVAAARKEMGEAWWLPVLWLRSRDGRLWEEEEEEVPTPTLPGGISVAGNVGTMQVVNVTGGSVGSIIGSQTNYGAPPAASGRSEAVSTQRSRLEQHRATLAHYLGQLAITGAAHARPEVTAGIREARAGIARAKAALAALREAAEDMPDDAP
jgi:CHAT domain